LGARHLSAALRPYLELVRLPAVFTAPADVLAGVALASWAGGVQLDARVGLLVGASAAVYCAGMAANDIFDLAVDLRERPGRPIPSGRITQAAAWRLVLTLQALGLALGALVGTGALLAVAGTIAATYAYNAVLKDGPLGPWAMGACRYGNAAIGFLGAAGAASLGWLPWAVPVSTVAYTAAVTWLSRHEAAGATPAQVRGPIWAMRLGALAPAAWLLAGAWPAPWAAAGAAVTLAWLWAPTQRALNTPGAGSVRGGVMAGIYGIALSGAVIAFMAGGWWQGGLAAGLLVPGRFFGRWFYST
jgi:hypothetical protein